MGKIAEFLAGCPRPDTHQVKKMPWQSLRAFPGFLLNRMYILLTRPHKAIAEFGAGDYKTPFCFFLFFTIILAVLQCLSGELQLVIMNYHFLSSAGQPDALDATMVWFTSSGWLFLLGILNSLILAFLLFGVSLIILVARVRLITGAWHWNPAFTICAYCLPVLLLTYAVLALVQTILIFFNTITWVFALVFTVAAIGYLILIAGSGITSLNGAPLVTSGILAFFFAFIAIVLVLYGPSLVVTSAEDVLTNYILQIWFPEGFPTAASSGKNP
jgi:hypothetical protein